MDTNETPSSSKGSDPPPTRLATGKEAYPPPSSFWAGGTPRGGISAVPYTYTPHKIMTVYSDHRSL